MERRRSLFRQKAIEAYRQRQEKDTLPRFVAPSILVLLYLLLLLLLVLFVGLLVWSGETSILTAGLLMVNGYVAT